MICVRIVLLIGVLSQLSTGDGSIHDTESPVVQTSNGPVKGYSFTSSWTNQTIYAFHGIPYAAPPIGDLRFKDPVLSEKWTSERDCTKEQNACMQEIEPVLVSLNLTFNISEDCLYLNIYTPKLSPDSPLPVMVYVFGGSFMAGSGNRFLYGPDFLVAEGVILVTFNYRLGAFGFLTLGTPEVAGNIGLKDQRFALQWVQREIHNFGGNPDEVTLFGNSAGSLSVHLQYISPLSKGLFHRVIAESGTALNWAVRENGTAYGLEFASILNCGSVSLSETYRCLLNTSAEDILKAQGMIKATEDDTLDGMMLAFIPTVDKTSSKEPFLPDLPSRLIKQRIGSLVPFMMGINSQEGIMMLFRGDSAINSTIEILDHYIPREVRSVSSPSRIKLLTKSLHDFYFNNTTTYNDIIRGYVDLYTDFMFGYETAVSAKGFRDRSSVYLYYFAFNGIFKDIPDRFLQSKYNISGVSHAEELSYLFVRANVNQTADPESRESTTLKRMVRMWTNFAKFGAPTVGDDPLLQNVRWTPVGHESTRYLRIDDNLTMEAQDFLGPSVALWDSITMSSGYIGLQVAGSVLLWTVVLYILV